MPLSRSLNSSSGQSGRYSLNSIAMCLHCMGEEKDSRMMLSEHQDLLGRLENSILEKTDCLSHFGTRSCGVRANTWGGRGCP